MPKQLQEQRFHSERIWDFGPYPYELSQLKIEVGYPLPSSIANCNQVEMGIDKP